MAAHPPPTVLPYIIRRLLWTVFLLFVVSGLTFIIFYVMPTADPAALRAGKSPTPEAVATVRKTLGLDRPPLEQYASYMGDVFTNFDFGRSYVSSAEVRPLILSRLPNTLFLIVGAVVVWLAVGLTVGTISAVRRGSRKEGK